jgi:ribosome-binding protein aMBF1 (putative translation factor)
MDEKSEDGKRKKEKKGWKRKEKERKGKRVQLKEMSYIVGWYVGYVRAARDRRGLSPL